MQIHNLHHQLVNLLAIASHVNPKQEIEEFCYVNQIPYLEDSFNYKARMTCSDGFLVVEYSASGQVLNFEIDHTESWSFNMANTPYHVPQYLEDMSYPYIENDFFVVNVDWSVEYAECKKNESDLQKALSFWEEFFFL